MDNKGMSWPKTVIINLPSSFSRLGTGTDNVITVAELQVFFDFLFFVFLCVFFCLVLRQ